LTEVEGRVSEPTCSGPQPGEPVTTLGELDLAQVGYVTQEWFLSGTANSWRSVGELGDHGRWEVAVSTHAPYKTRLLVCRPSDPTKFNGTVVAEWLNVSGGGDGSPGWFYLHRHLMREGAAWVGVSAQKAGIDGGGLLDSGQHLKNVAPERYQTLTHPGDAFSFDIFSQAGTSLRAVTGPLADLKVDVVLAAGESQSAAFLVTYVNAIDPQAGIYDGFLIHGRGASGASFEGHMRARHVSRQRAFDSEFLRDAWTAGHQIRDDARVPVITVQSETDVVMMSGIRARQPDNEHFRLWEIAGAAHFDTYGLLASRHDDGTLNAADLAALLAPTDEALGHKAAALVNAGPQQHYVLNAALAHLESWFRQGRPPPTASRLETTEGGDPVLVLDDFGIVRGGVRTPWVDAPVAALSGLGQTGRVFTALFGTTRPFNDAELAQLYPEGRDQYLTAFERCLGEAIDSGFILQADRDEILALAAAGCPL
jgi:alpha/beta hydrolase family protein